MTHAQRTDHRKVAWDVSRSDDATCFIEFQVDAGGMLHITRALFGKAAEEEIAAHIDRTSVQHT